MEVLDLDTFISFKLHQNCQELDTTTVDLIHNLFGNLDKNKRNKKMIKKGNTNFLKNHKVQTKKDSITNRVNLILNKLSESNIDSLIIEFLENINQVDLDTYEEIQKTFYLKIISEINFIKIYLQFLKTINYVYNCVQKYDLSVFISSVETKFKLDYVDSNMTSDNNSGIDETKRLNNLILIKNLIDYKIVSEDLGRLCDDLIIKQEIFLPDIYYWYNSKNRKLTDFETNQIKKLLKKNGINQRETVLLETLINKKVEIEKQSQPVKPLVKKEVIKTDTFKLESENIIEEYLLVKSFDDVKYFIEHRCEDAITKNKFCEYLLDRYFSSNKESATEIEDLVKQLVKTQTLYKSNLSRGLLLINNAWKEKTIDYNKPAEKMKNILILLKSIGITKGIEFLIENYKV